MLTSPLKSLKSTQIVIMVSGQPVQIFHSIYSCVRFLNLFLCEIIQFFFLHEIFKFIPSLEYDSPLPR